MATACACLEVLVAFGLYRRPISSDFQYKGAVPVFQWRPRIFGDRAPRIDLDLWVKFLIFVSPQSTSLLTFKCCLLLFWGQRRCRARRWLAFCSTHCAVFLFSFFFCPCTFAAQASWGRGKQKKVSTPSFFDEAKVFAFYKYCNALGIWTFRANGHRQRATHTCARPPKRSTKMLSLLALSPRRLVAIVVLPFRAGCMHFTISFVSH